MRILNTLLATLILAGILSGCVVYTRPGPYWHPCYRCY